MRRIRGWQKEFGNRVANDFEVSSVLDLGCASGYYLEGFYAHGSKIQGVEYLYDQAKPFMSDAVSNFIFKGDVGKDLGHLIDEKFDMTMSIEVAEHILPEDSERLIKNLVNNSLKYILFSAATYGQKGTGHINLRNINFWLDRFAKGGFIYSDVGTKKIRSMYNTLSVKSPYTRCLSRQVF